MATPSPPLLLLATSRLNGRLVHAGDSPRPPTLFSRLGGRAFPQLTNLFGMRPCGRTDLCGLGVLMPKDGAFREMRDPPFFFFLLGVSFFF